VFILCGDLSDVSKLGEFRKTLQLHRNLNTPWKLVVAGNHDFTMDIPAFEKRIEEAVPALGPELVKMELGAHGESQQLFA
jgi:Calcineurin-like phosphoesterase